METRAFIPTRDLVIFPGVIAPLFIGREESITSLEKALNGDKKMIFCMQKDFMNETPDLDKDIHKIGVIADILQEVKMPNNTIKVLVEAKARVIVEKVKKEDGAYVAEYTVVEGSDVDEITSAALQRKVYDSFEKYARLNTKIAPDFIINLKMITDLNRMLDMIASKLQIESDLKQALLEMFDTEARAYELMGILSKEIEIASIEKDIDNKVKDRLNQAQKSYYIKEKINVMKEELEDVPEDEDIKELKDKVKKAKLPKKAKEKVDKELKRLTKMPAFSAEATVTRTYIENVTDLPWNKESKDMLDVPKAKEILDADHYGLKEVKERILEYLSVKKLNPKMKGSIICLAGPPGVGKTSLAKSVADAMGRKFVRVSLGGVRDESEIRGHRKTYIGSMPGRIIKAMKEAGTKNPLILLDEIDKMSNDFKGDPSSAMLEVLDPEQNNHFEDHYLDMPFDLSKAFFISTANDLRTIPGPLRDRMEIITLTSYTEFEKLHIAKKYLVPQAKEENGLTKISLEISENGLLKLINEYTREAGVRTLKREINSLFRKIAREVIEEDKKKIQINVNNLKKYMGKVKYRPDKQREKKTKLGVVNGLAWTSVGGVSLEVQGVSMPGKGKLSLTGTLGNVMKESAAVALTYVRSNAEKYGIENNEIFDKTDLHLHFPEGATPKDGPSAGIAITSTIVSVLSNREVRQDIAMTGEVTIRGEVLPVGGIKEKVIGAHRVGIREVILPYDNEADVADIPKEVSKDMKINLVKNYSEVEKIIFE